MYQPLIIQHLFQVSSLEDVSRERLEAFVESYPSYGIGHYLLSCKLQAEGSDRFLPETQRTCLYFSNPLWLQWQLQNTNGEVAAQASHASALETVPTPPAVESYPSEPAPEAAALEPAVEPLSPEPAVEAATPDPVVAFTSTSTAFAPEENVPLEDAPLENVAEADAETPVANVVTMAEEAFGGAATDDDLAEALTSAGTTPHAGEPSAADLLLRSIEEARGLRDALQKLQEEAPAVQEVTAPQEDPIHDEEAPFVLEESEEQPEPATVEAVAKTPAEAQPEMAAPAAGAETSKKSVTATQDFLFEPYHTIDYFASQGIKLTLEENPTDNLGKQLKSFTEWLKTMRRLPQKDREVVPDRVAEEAIQTIAAHSVKGKDVLTETMAEVLAKQGMREKARAVYEKLSLLNPDKSAYFAAKIEQLNIP